MKYCWPLHNNFPLENSEKEVITKPRIGSALVPVAMGAVLFAVASAANAGPTFTTTSALCEDVNPAPITVRKIAESTGSLSGGTLNDMSPDAWNDSSGIQGFDGSYNKCQGFYLGNPSGNALGGSVDPVFNIGYDNDGLLNYSEFDDLIDNEFTDIPGNDSTEDPGWIKLLKYELVRNEDDVQVPVSTYEGVGKNPVTGGYAIQLGDFMEFTMTEPPFEDIETAEGSSNTGSWSLRIDPGIVAAGQALLGPQSTFRQLAFVFKQANAKDVNDEENRGWAVYTFDFNPLIDAGVLATDKAYNFYGGYDFTGVFGSGISNLQVFAQDPIVENGIPLPSTLLIFWIGLLGLFGSKLRQRML